MSGPQSPVLCDAALAFLGDFVSEDQPDETYVQVVLNNGESLYFNGLRIDKTPGAPDIVMLRHAASPSPAALVVQQASIVRFEYTRPSPADPDRPLGFRHDQ